MIDDTSTTAVAASSCVPHHPQIAGKRPAPHHMFAQQHPHWLLDASSSESDSGSDVSSDSECNDTPAVKDPIPLAAAVTIDSGDGTTSPVPWSPTMHRRSTSPVQPPAPPMRPRTRRTTAVYVAPRESHPSSAVPAPVPVTRTTTGSPTLPPQAKRRCTVARRHPGQPTTYTKELKLDDQQKVHMLYIVHVFKETSSTTRACGWCDGCRAPPCGTCDNCVSNQAPGRTHAKLARKRCKALTCRLITQRTLVPSAVDADWYGRFSLELQPLLHELVNTEKKRMRWAKAAYKHKLSDRGCIARQLRDLAEHQLELALLHFRSHLERLSVDTAKLVHTFLDLRKRKYIE